MERKTEMIQHVIKALSIAGILFGGTCGCSKDGTTHAEGEYTPKNIVVEASPASLLSLEGGEQGSVALAATGNDAVNLTAYVTAVTDGWSAEIVGWSATGNGYAGTINITAPAKTSNGAIWIAVKDAEGEVRTKEIKVACRGIDAGDDPYSTPSEQCYVKAEQIGGSPVACNVRLTPNGSVKRYYYACYQRKEIEKFEFFYPGTWRTDIRDGIIAQLNASSFDYWLKNSVVFRYDTIDDGETEMPLTPNSEYYVLVVVQLADGSYADLEISHLQTLPKSEREYEPAPAEHVAVKVEQTAYDNIIATVTPDETVECFRYELADDYDIGDYKALYGKSWNVGYLDLWMYNLKYYYPSVYPEGLITGEHTYQFTNCTPSKTYHLMITYVDKAGEMHLETTDIRTADKPAIKGSPQVAITQKAITETTVTFDFAPNGDCGLFTVDIWSESDTELFKAKYREGYPQILIQYASKYGMMLDKAAEVTLDINDFYPMATGYTRYWTSNDYHLVVMPFDKDEVYDETAITYTPIRYTGSTATIADKSKESSGRPCIVEIAEETPARAWTRSKRVERIMLKTK